MDLNRDDDSLALGNGGHALELACFTNAFAVIYQSSQ